MKNKTKQFVKMFAGGLLAAISAWLFYLLIKPETHVENIKAGRDVMSELLEHDGLRQLAQQQGFGGAFDKSVFQPLSDADTLGGVMLWYCYNTHKNVFYLAAERAMVDALPGLPTCPQQITSQALSLYKAASVAEFLENDVKTPTGSQYQTCDSTKKAIDAFMQLLKKYDPKNELKQTYHAFFQNNKDIDLSSKKGLLQLLCEQPGTSFVRYYFGCNTKMSTNKIRILLFSVDKVGKNILWIDQAKKEQALALQRSIPPVNQ